GTLALADTGVIPGVYGYPVNLEVDSRGRVVNVSASLTGFVERSGSTKDTQVAVWDGNDTNLVEAVPVTISSTGAIANATSVDCESVTASTGNIQAPNGLVSGQGVTWTSAAADRVVLTDASKNLAVTSALADGQLLIGSTGAAP